MDGNLWGSMSRNPYTYHISSYLWKTDGYVWKSMGNDGSSAWKSVDVSGGPWIIIGAAVTLHAIRRWQTSCRLANIRASNSSCTSAVAIAAANQLHRPRRTTANIRTSNSSRDISSSVMIGWVYYLQQQPSSQLVWQKSVFVSFLFTFES